MLAIFFDNIWFGMAFFKWVINSEYICLVCSKGRKPWQHNVFDGDDILNVVGEGVYPKDTYVCEPCSNEQKKINSRHQEKARHIEVFSHRYEGKIPKTDKFVVSPEFKDRDEAENYLKLLAVLNRKEAVTDLKFNKSTESEMNFNSKGKHTGDYKYTVWKASGKI